MPSTRDAPRLEPRPGSAPVRCVACHDDAAGAEPCDGCGALTHDECLLATRGCPTLGCAWAGEVPARPDPKADGATVPVALDDAPPAGADRRLPALLPAVVVVALLMFVLTAFADRFVWVHGQRIDGLHVDHVDVFGAR